MAKSNVVSFVEALNSKREATPYENDDGDWVLMPIVLPGSTVFDKSQIAGMVAQLNLLKLSKEAKELSEFSKKVFCSVNLKDNYKMRDLMQRYNSEWTREWTTENRSGLVELG